MKLDDYREVVACLGGGRVLYHYYPDRYAFMLLGWASGGRVRLEQLRSGPFGSLLQKPAVRNLLSDCGGATVDRELFDSYWPAETRSFVLELDRWHGFQTSRQGLNGHNLVLQMNFTHEHMETLRRRFGCTDLFNSSAHPVQQKTGDQRRETFAWARIDLDLERDEALIEEVQSDWVSTLGWAMSGGLRCNGKFVSQAELKCYRDNDLGWLSRQWADAMLAATISLLRVELGISKVYFHTFEGGNLTKNMGRWVPPRSVYSTLPKRFCLTRTPKGPRFLRDDRRMRRLLKARRDIEFFELKETP